MTKDMPLGRQPSRMGRADLGSAFGEPPDRARGLAGRLSPVASVPDPTPDPAPEADPRADDRIEPLPGPAAPTRVPAGQPGGRARTTGGPRPRPRTSSGGVQPIVVYLPASLRERLRARATGQTTFTDLVLSALDATHERLGDHFTPAAASTSMFTGRGPRRRLRHDEPQVQVSLRPVTDDLTIIDQLTASLGAPSRSALITAALDLYLT